MEKDFFSWHVYKSEIESSAEESLMFHEKEIGKVSSEQFVKIQERIIDLIRDEK